MRYFIFLFLVACNQSPSPRWDPAENRLIETCYGMLTYGNNYQCLIKTDFGHGHVQLSKCTSRNAFGVVLDRIDKIDYPTNLVEQKCR